MNVRENCAATQVRPGIVVPLVVVAGLATARKTESRKAIAVSNRRTISIRKAKSSVILSEEPKGGGWFR